MRIDGDVIARGRNGASRAEVEAAPASDNAGPRMRAELGSEGDIARLVESADEIARFENRLEHAGGIAGIGAQIALAQICRGEERRAAGKVEHDVAMGHRAVAPGAEGKRAARGWRGMGVVIDRELEGAEI